MNNWSFKEITLWARWTMSQLVGAQLQDIWTDGEVLVLELYKFQNFWICLDLRMQAPALAALKTRPPIKKKPKPLTLFLNSHAKNLRVENLRTDPALGRYIEIQLSNKEKKCRIEFIMIPRMVNVIVHAEGKLISWNKPHEIPLSKTPNPDPEYEEIDGWDWGQLWLEKRQSNRSQQSGDKSLQFQKDLEKKKKALAALLGQTLEDTLHRWKTFGEKLKENLGAQIIPDDYKDLYEQRLSFKENMENAFAQVKKLRIKQEGSLERVNKLRSEISELERKWEQYQLHPSPQEIQKPESRAQKISEDKSIKTQRIPIGDFELLIGKSGKDNLALLRQAQAWDYWIHLKDEPGAHGILVRPRNREAPPTVIEQAAFRVLRASKAKGFVGKFDVIVVECRYVRPIKGDRLGRVTYHNPRVYTFASKG